MKRLSGLFMLLSLLLLFMLTPAGAAEEFSYTVDLQTDSLSPASEISLAALPETAVFDYDSPGYGAQLEDPIAVAAYNTLAQHLTPSSDTVRVDLSSIALDDLSQITAPIQAALSAYVFDHPESQYCLIGNYRVSYSLDEEGRIANAAVTYIVRQDSRSAAMKEALDAYLETFCADFDTTLPVSEQYRAIHDHICDLAVYNHSAAAAGVVSDAHTLYGLLVLKQAVVCEGYAKSFKILCDAVGLPCILVNGEASQADSDGKVHFTGRSNHMWNAVELDGSWYSVDTTWDDMDTEEGSLPGCPDMALSLTSYDYFLNNTPFLPENPAQDHRSTGNIYFLSSFPMTFALPELAVGSFPGSGTSPGRLTISYFGSTLEIPDMLWDYQLGTIPLQSISDITIRLFTPQTLSHTLSVPAGKSYVLTSPAEQPLTIARSDGFDGPLFLLSGALTLHRVSPDTTPSLPLATVSGGSISGADVSQMTCRPPSGTEEFLCLQASYDTSGAMTRITSLDTSDLTYGSLFPSGGNGLTRSFLLDSHTLAPLSFDLIP